MESYTDLLKACAEVAIAHAALTTIDIGCVTACAEALTANTEHETSCTEDVRAHMESATIHMEVFIARTVPVQPTHNVQQPPVTCNSPCRG